MVARDPLEASSFAGVWKEVREGGAVAFDLSGLSTPRKMGFAQALLRFLFALVEEEEKVPFVFFEAAHLYVTPQGERCPRDESKTHRDHELLHHEYTHSAFGSGF